MTVKTVEPATPVAVAESESARLERLAQSAPPITTNPERMGGAPVIGIERLPVTTLLDYLLDNYTVAQFCQVFGCAPEQVERALQTIRDAFEDGRLTALLAERVDY
jgi:uncharacterized protein (DUF433 family)